MDRFSERMVNMLGYIFLLILCLPLLIPMLIVGLIIHCINKKKRREQMAVNNSSQMNGEGMNVSEIPLPQQSAAQAVYQAGGDIPIKPSKPKKHREPLSSSTVMLLIGTALVVLSGIAFGAANWLNTSPLGRVAIIMTASVVSFLISLLFGKGVKLKGTSIAFYIVGSLMIPVAMTVAGYYDLFGRWFSVFGGGRYLLFALGFAMTAAASAAGARIYKSKPFIYSGLTATSITTLFAAFQAGFINGTVKMDIVCTLLIIIQTILTAAIFLFRLHEKTPIAHPVKIIGTITAIIYAIISINYVFVKVDRADLAVYFILLAMIAQLILYGVRFNKKWMMGIQCLLSILLAVVFSANAFDNWEWENQVLLCSYIITALYFVNTIIPQLKNRFSTLVSLAAMFIFSYILLECMKMLTPVISMIVPLVFTIIMYAYTFSDSKLTQFVSGLITPLMPCLMAVCYDDYHYSLYESGSGYSYFIAAAILVAVSALIFFLPKYADSINERYPRKSNSVIYAGLIVSLIILISNIGSDIMIAVPLVIAVGHFIVADRQKLGILSVGSALSFIGYIVYGIERYESDKDVRIVIYFLIFLAMMGISRLAYRQSAVFKKDGRTVFDAPLLSGWALIPFICDSGRYGEFFGLLTLAIYIACFIKKNTKEKKANIMLSASAILTALSLINRPFFVPTEPMISNKITFAIIAMVGVAFRFIWRKNEQAAKRSSNLIFICTFGALMMDALYFENGGNTVFVLTVTTAILIAAFMIKSKTWFSVSSIAICLMIVYSAKDFLGSLSGWVYLFAAGILLIGVASVNEYFKQRGETVRSKLAKVFSDWTW